MSVELQNKRESGIELLRILAGVFVVILHYNYIGEGGAMRNVTGGAFYFLQALEVISVTAVNIYILICGYFSCESTKIKFSKVVLILIEVIFINVLVYIVASAIGWKIFDKSELLSCLIPSNWFVTLYIALILVSPLLNIVLRTLETKQLRYAILLILLLFSVFPISIDILRGLTGWSLYGLSPVSSSGNNAGYTLVNFMMLYMIGAYIKKEELKKVKTKVLSLVLLLSLVIIYIWRNVLPDSAWPYYNPFLIVASASFLCLFLKLKFYSPIINYIAPASFVCFLIHDMILLRIPFGELAGASILKVGCHLAITVLCIYIIAIAIQTIWNIINKLLINRLIRRIPSIDLVKNQ